MCVVYIYLHLHLHAQMHTASCIVLYTRLTHSNILKQEQQPQCETCQTHLTVKRLFMECRFFAHIRNRYFKANNMKDLFENVNMEDILSFLKEIELYHRI